MRYEFKLPDLAEGMAEGEVVDWLVGQGDTVAEEQPVVEVMTDKATVVISSPKAGTVIELPFEAGDIAEVGAVLFVLDIEAGGQAGAAQAGRATSPAKQPASTAPAAAVATTQPVAPAPSAARVPRGAGKVMATPATRRLAREMGVDISQVSGTGPAGRVTANDVQDHAAEGARPPARATMTSPLPSKSVDPAPAPPPTTGQARARVRVPPVAPAARPASGDDESTERVRIRGLRRAIYDTMHRSKNTAAHFTYVEELDCTNLMAVRNRLRPAAEGNGVKLTYMPFIAKAAVLALRHFPHINASVDDEAGEIVVKRFYHVGIAAATEAGLTVPVVRHADRLTLYELANCISDVADKARRGKLSPAESRGSTFTITSLGRIGGLFATPIIDHPEVAIMGIHKIEQRAVVRDGEIVVRPMMNVSFSFDHRVVDGHVGAEFAQVLLRYLRDPELMLLEMA